MPEGAGPLGILGGTFDPVHRAHVHLARAALKQLRLSGVLWIPAGQPWHRQTPCTPAEHRLAMVRLAIAGEPAFAVDATEALSGAPGYTVPTLEAWRGLHGEARSLVLLMGADAFLGLPTWHRWQDIFRLAHVAVAARPGAPLAAEAMAPELADQYRRRQRSQFTALARAPAGSIVGFDIEPVEPPDLSATAVRELLHHTPERAADLLPAGVLDYIRSHHLYTD
jgi:nicotinate-nucleotide adenylyltransferase